MTNLSLLLSVYIAVFSSISFPVISAYACEPLSYRTGVTVHCEHPVTKESVDCRSEKVPVRTVVKYHCDDYYLTQDGDRSGGSMKCDENGNWTPEQHFRAFSCNIDCGRLSDSASTTYWPWHAAIFVREHSSAPFKYSCGGTLINPFNSGFVVLTAARCLRSSDGHVAELSNIKVSMGLITTDFRANEASEESKTFSLQRISLENQGGLALLKFEQDVHLSRNVLPACFNGNSDVALHQLQEGAMGKFVGFRKIQSQQRSSTETLRSFGVRISKNGDCRGKVGTTEFCAGNRATRNICSGDQGSGLLFNMYAGSSERSYLQGILTEIIEDSNECQHFVPFTRVNDFAGWIKDTSRLFSSVSDAKIQHNKPIRRPQPEIAPNTGPEVAFQTGNPNSTRLPIPSLLNPTPTENQKYYRPISSIGNHRQKPPQPSNQTPSNVPSRTPESAAETGDHVFNPTDYELVGLERHNYYRAKHGSPPLRLSPELNRVAQAEATRSLQENKYRFEGFTNYYGLNGGNLNSTRVVHEAITDWYKTSANYDYTRPRALPFMNIVWRATTEIGVGVSRKGPKQIVVVKYNRPLAIDGEREREFRENIHPPIPYTK